VSTEFFCEWHEAQYTDLLTGGYVPGMTGAFDGMYRDHQVLVMTTGICLSVACSRSPQRDIKQRCLCTMLTHRMALLADRVAAPSPS
jgi:hypothetical protein